MYNKKKNIFSLAKSRKSKYRNSSSEDSSLSDTEKEEYKLKQEEEIIKEAKELTKKMKIEMLQEARLRAKLSKENEFSLKMKNFNLRISEYPSGSLIQGELNIHPHYPHPNFTDTYIPNKIFPYKKFLESSQNSIEKLTSKKNHHDPRKLYASIQRARAKKMLFRMNSHSHTPIDLNKSNSSNNFSNSSSVLT